MSIRFQGTQIFYDMNGNELECKVQSLQGNDKGFTKVWLTDFMAKLELIGNQKLKLAFWIIEHVDSKTHYLNYSQRQIAKESGIGLNTVNETMKALEEADFLRKVNKVYMLNPEVLFKGYSSNARQAILTEYITGESPKELPIEERIKNISRTLKQLANQKALLKKQLDEIQTKADLQISELDSLKQEQDTP